MVPRTRAPGPTHLPSQELVGSALELLAYLVASGTLCLQLSLRAQGCGVPARIGRTNGRLAVPAGPAVQAPPPTWAARKLWMLRSSRALSSCTSWSLRLGGCGTRRAGDSCPGAA